MEEKLVAFFSGRNVNVDDAVFFPSVYMYISVFGFDSLALDALDKWKWIGVRRTTNQNCIMGKYIPRNS